MKRNKPNFNMPIQANCMTKQEFLITWVLARASFREDFSGVAAAKAAEEVWKYIQTVKDKE